MAPDDFKSRDHSHSTKSRLRGTMKHMTGNVSVINGIRFYKIPSVFRKNAFVHLREALCDPSCYPLISQGVARRHRKDYTKSHKWFEAYFNRIGKIAVVG